ncbi:MAG: AAA family ATPase [Candidatus Bathyarchaeia archaeon]|nr:AAA family ATPase [Candidatus Bathyarchaeia archaeon]
MKGTVKGLWNIVLSGYPRSGKTMLAKRLIAENPYFARVGVDELREMLFNETPPCRDEFVVYSMIADMRDELLEKGYSVVIDSTAPDNITRQFLLTTRKKHVNSLLIMLIVDRAVLIKRNIEKFGDARAVIAWDKRWQKLAGNIPVFKFKSSNPLQFEVYYTRLKELLESETHPYKPEFHRIPKPLKEVKEALKNLLKKHNL